MKVYICATSGDDNYPTICGIHEFNTLEEAINFARFGAKGFNPKEGEELVIRYNVPNYYKSRYGIIDLIIEIYDDYRE